MQTFVTVVHVTTCILLVLVVLIQSGKGAEISASFGGSSQTVFGSSGGANFFTRFTQISAGIFFVTSLVLTLMGGQSRKSIFEGTPAAVPAKPAATAPATGAATTTTAPAAGTTATATATSPATTGATNSTTTANTGAATGTVNSAAPATAGAVQAPAKPAAAAPATGSATTTVPAGKK